MKDMVKKILILLVVIFLVSIGVFFAIKNSNKLINEQASTNKKDQNLIEVDGGTKKTNDIKKIDFKAKAKEMAAEPKPGEEVAIMTVKNYGEIRIKFFKDVAPKAVENFLTHAKNGYYNGLTFHRVINDFMIQGGDPNGDGRGGQSIWGEGFAKEVSSEYFPFRGTLCMASSPGIEKSLGSQFFITQAKYADVSVATGRVPAEIVEAYKEFGGAPHLYGEYTVFGFVYKGLDIVDKIASVKTGQNDRPETPVVIEKIEVITQK